MMNIGNVIKKYRKELGYTQEEMANRLGVTTPAVNKWENGNSNPDIELLAPIARLLHISLDTLLSFHENLTDLEIEELIHKMEKKQLLNNVDTLGDFQKSQLYKHMKFREVENPYTEEMKKELLEGFRNAEEFAYMKGYEPWEKLLSGN